MKIVRPDAGSSGELQVSAPVMIVRGVQRLMHIADEVQKKLEREASLLLAGRGVLTFRREFVDLIDHAGIRRSQGRDALVARRQSPKTRRLQIRTVQFQ